MSSMYDSISSEDLKDNEGLESGMPPGRERKTEREDRDIDNELESIIGDDDRKQVLTTTNAPWCYICALTITMPYGTMVGTGWLISPRTIITAGHCVYDLKRGGGLAMKIAVTPGKNGSNAAGPMQTATKFRVLAGWEDGQKKGRPYAETQRYDYAAILLDPPYKAPGYFSFAAIANEQAVQKEDTNIAGYPLERDGSAKDGTHMFWHARRIAQATATTLEYETDTYGGQSGSPIWLKMDGQRYVVGIHTRGVTDTQPLNGGVRITSEVFTTLKKWKNEGLL
jgi:glutamyl endopeptidase